MLTSNLLRHLLATLFTSFLFSLMVPAHGQMRKVYLDAIQPENEIHKISFYSPSEGYVAFRDWIGYTTDSGRTFTKKYITFSNVNYNGYSVNLTFGFGITGVQAFNQNTLVAYGDYGLVPAILHSTNGGISWNLIFHSQYNPQQINGGITDMVFPGNGTTGYAIDANRILKSINQGLSWTVSSVNPLSFFSDIEAVDVNNLFVLSTEFNGSKLLKTTNAGASWSQITLPSLPSTRLAGAFFLTAANGWMGMTNNGRDYLYKTTNAGGSWTLLNDPDITPFASNNFQFVDNNTGYGLYEQNTVYKTLNGGVTWEPLPRDNNFAYLGFSHNDLFLGSATQLWAGGSGLLEMSTNGGGTPLPKSYFKIDTVGLYSMGNVNLVNYSRSGYTYKWFLNNVLISTLYNASYAHDPNRTLDTIKLVVENGALTDTVTKYQSFYPPVLISSFSPTVAGIGNTVNIFGSNFSGATSVSFGGVAATNFTVVSSTNVRATVGSGASGNVTVSTTVGQGSLAGFIFLPPPVISSFSPVSATAGTTISITGNNFTNATAVSFAGIAASYTVVSPTLITAIAPSGGSGNISLTTPGGSTTIAGYVSLPAITSFTPLSGTQGTIITITGTSFTGATAVSVGGVPVQSFSVVSSTTITAVAGSGASGSVIVTKPGGNATLAGFTWFAPPVISSFLPAFGPVGTTVTITGSGFSNVPANNIIYFGPVKATVVSSTTTTVVVTVPVGATFDPISITNNNLIAYAAYPFLLTFPNGGSISAASFISPTVLTSIDNGMMDIRLGDLDGDGKTDMAVSHYYSQNAALDGVFLYRNTSSTTTVSFDAPINLVTGSYDNLAIGDLDGDGKLDLAVITGGGGSLSLYRNTSVNGAISFSAPVIINGSGTVFGFRGLTIGDVDGDGKAEVLTSLYQYPDYKASVFRNISNPGTIAFAPIVMLNSKGGRNILLTDMDGDTKPDMVLPSSVEDEFYVLKNNSTINTVSFSAATIFPGYSHSNMAYGDMDGDGKTDLVSSDNNGSRMHLLRNISTTNNFAFAPSVQFDATSTPGGIAVSDLDGDGKLDVAIALSNTSLGVYKNFSTPGNISMAAKIDYAPTSNYGGQPLAIGDINGDGKNDVITISETQRSVNVHINKVVPEPYIQSFTPTLGATGTTVTITGGNFTGVTAVRFGNVAASSFTVNSATSITAVVGSGASGAVSVTNSFGTGTRSGFVFGIPPVITSISPVTGAVGSSVVISGNNFNPVAASNMVYLGTVRAVITAASATSLTVTVPAGPALQPFTVTTNNLTAYSAQLFNVTFPGAGSTFTAGSFAARINAPAGGSGNLCDVDGDGKLDYVILNGTNTISISRNTSTSGIISFAAATNITTTVQPSGFAFGDIDGDGKTDIVTFNDAGNSMSVMRNLSTVGNIVLQSATTYLTGPSTTSPQDIAVNDLDGDGRPDIVVANYYSQTVTIFKNQSTVGAVSLAARIDYQANGYPTGLVLKDIDGDNKPEIVLSSNSSNTATILRNISVIGTISFTNNVAFAAGNWPDDVEACDLDNDGKLDVLIPNVNGTSLSVFRNNSTAGAVTLSPKQDFTTGAGPRHVAVADLDGDGKPDAVVSNSYNANTGISLFKNISTTGNISLQAKYDIAIPGNTVSTTIGDVDGDGLPDIIVYNSTGPFILRNTTGSAIAAAVCAGANTTLTSTVTGTSYQWQQNTSTGFANISDNSNFTGTSTASLQLTNVPAGWNNYEYKCIVNGTQSSAIYRLTVNAATVASVAIATPAVNICAGTSATFTATPVNGGTAPAYQWQVNGVNAGTNNPVFTTSTLTNGSQVKVLLTSNAACATPAIATSNVIAMTVNPAVVPTVSIATPAISICAGSSATFTATSINGGTPAYQWQVNGVNTGTNNPVFTSSTLINGSQVRVLMTSTAACATVAAVTSNTIGMSISSAVQPGVSIAATDTTVCFGTSVSFTATPVNGGAIPAYQWQVNGVNAGTNNPVFTASSLGDGSQVRVIVTSSLACAVPITANSNNIVVHVNPVTVPSVSITASAISVCPGSTIVFTATPVNGGNNPGYQWKRNGVNTGANSAVFTAATLTSGDAISVVLTSNAACATPAVVTSNNIGITVYTALPAVSISGDTMVNAGSAATITATVTNSNSVPAYEWQDSTPTHTWTNITGANSGSITYTPATSSKIRCIVNNASSCITTPVISNVLRITVTPLGGRLMVINYFPNPVHNTLIIDSLKLSDGWETLNIVGMYGERSLITQNIMGQVRTSVPVAKLSQGVYVAVLRRSGGKPFSFKFIKL